MKARVLVSSFLNFFKEKEHKILPSASLIPRNDPTALFINSGMHPLVPYLLGEPHPLGKRLASLQKCVRTDDIDEVGDTYHHTFFEMLGNWSLGDYFKKEAIEWSEEFLARRLELAKERLFVSVFAGDNNAPADEFSAETWRKVGIPKERIFFLPKKDNWWGPAGKTGPCGPDTEIYYDTLKKPCGAKCRPGCQNSCGKYIEIWNNVFMEFNLNSQGKIEPLKQKNVDTGLGLERTTAVLQGKSDNYETELFVPMIKTIESISSAVYQNGEKKKPMRIIADHLRAAAFIIADGIIPSNKEQGYILRRLIRRAKRRGKQLGIKNLFLSGIAETVVKEYRDFYPELQENRSKILEELKKEEERFGKTLSLGLKELEKMIGQLKGEKILPGRDIFFLYESYGFPWEETREIAGEKGVGIDEEGFRKAFLAHQELSRKESSGRFAGGLADKTEETTRLHTATHLLLSALRNVFGNHVFQKGSNITAERLRFDFSLPRKPTSTEIEKIENEVNGKINENLKVHFKTMSLAKARELGATGVFGEKYLEKVKVYFIGDYSKEICGGPHVPFTKTLGRFKIIKEESAGAQVRRIYGVLSL